MKALFGTSFFKDGLGITFEFIQAKVSSDTRWFYSTIYNMQGETSLASIGIVSNSI